MCTNDDVQVPSTDVLACNARPVGVASTTTYPSSPGVFQPLVVDNQSPIPETSGTRAQVPRYYLLYGTPSSNTEMLSMTRDESLDFSSEPQSLSSASDGTQSTLLSQISDESDQSCQRFKTSVSRISNLSDDTEQNRWPFNNYREIKKVDMEPIINLETVTKESENSGKSDGEITSEGASKFGDDTSKMDERDRKKVSRLSESREDRDRVTPPSKILESCTSDEQACGQSADLFSIPLAELLQPKDIGWSPPEQTLPPVDDFTSL